MGDLGDWYDCDVCGKLDCECYGIVRDHRASTLAWWRYTAIDNLTTCLDHAATLAAVHRMGYAKGYEHGSTLRDFCDGDIFEPYFPMADTRPTAERLGWPALPQSG